MDLDYYTKYLKYKQKYIELKSIIRGAPGDERRLEINQNIIKQINLCSQVVDNFSRYPTSRVK